MFEQFFRADNVRDPTPPNKPDLLATALRAAAALRSAWYSLAPLGFGSMRFNPVFIIIVTKNRNSAGRLWFSSMSFNLSYYNTD